MIKTPLYTYLGTNGTITSPIHLEGIYSVVKYRLEAENGKKLTKDNKSFVKEVVVAEDDIELWEEVTVTVSSK